MTIETRPTLADASAQPPPDRAASLAQIEAARTRQLESLPSAKVAPVSVAYRGSLERILDDVRTARARLAAGLYGVCSRCEATIPAARLELRLWATTCTGCDRQRA